MDSEAGNRAIRRAFDGNQTLNVTVVAGTSTAPPSSLGDNQIWLKVFDDTTNTIRVVYV
jgi:hypothetical protein